MTFKDHISTAISVFLEESCCDLEEQVKVLTDLRASLLRGPLKQQRYEAEKDRLAYHGQFSMDRAAAIAQVHPHSLQRIIKRLGIEITQEQSDYGRLFLIDRKSLNLIIANRGKPRKPKTFTTAQVAKIFNVNSSTLSEWTVRYGLTRHRPISRRFKKRVQLARTFVYTKDQIDRLRKARERETKASIPLLNRLRKIFRDKLKNTPYSANGRRIKGLRRQALADWEALRQETFKEVQATVPPHIRRKLVLVNRGPRYFDPDLMRRENGKVIWVPKSERVQHVLDQNVAPLFYSNSSRIISLDQPLRNGDLGFSLLHRYIDQSAPNPEHELLEAEAVNKIIQRLVTERAMPIQQARQLVMSCL